MSNKQKNVSLPEEQIEYIEEENLNASKLLQEKIEEHKNREFYSQLNINTEWGKMEIFLRNYPKVVDSRESDKRDLPVPLYRSAGGKLVEEPPVYKEEGKKEDVKIIKREDNDKVCGIIVDNWTEEHDDLSLVYTKDSENPHIVLDPPKM